MRTADSNDTAAIVLHNQRGPRIDRTSLGRPQDRITWTIDESWLRRIRRTRTYDGYFEGTRRNIALLVTCIIYDVRCANQKATARWEIGGYRNGWRTIIRCCRRCPVDNSTISDCIGHNAIEITRTRR